MPSSEFFRCPSPHRIDSFSNGLYRETRHTQVGRHWTCGGNWNSSREYVAGNAWIISFARVASMYGTYIPQYRYCDGYYINRKPVRIPLPSISDLSNSIHPGDFVCICPSNGVRTFFPTFFPFPLSAFLSYCRRCLLLPSIRSRRIL